MIYLPNPIEDHDTFAAASYRFAVAVNNLWIATGMPEWLERALKVVSCFVSQQAADRRREG